MEELALMLNESEKEPESDPEVQLEENLSYMNARDADSVKKIIKYHLEVISHSLEDVRPSTVSVKHRFDLTSHNPIY